MSKSRLYTEKEISTILKRAGERQSENGSKETQGLSLEEIQQIAGEVGIDPSIVASVAAELDFVDDKKGLSWTGLDAKIEVERVLPGEVTEEDWGDIIQAIESELDVVGASGQIGRTMEWTYTSRFVQHRISFNPGDGQTRVRMYGNYSKLSNVWAFPLTIFLFMQGFAWSLGAGLPLWGSGGIGLVIGLMAYTLIRFVFSEYIQKKERAFHKVLGRVERMLPEPSNPIPEPRGHVELPEEERSENSGESGRSRNRVT